MHAANPEKSYRLNRFLSVLRKKGHRGATSWELIMEAQTAAPGTCASELRTHGYKIDCKRDSEVGGTRIYRYTLLGKE